MPKTRTVRPLNGWYLTTRKDPDTGLLRKMRILMKNGEEVEHHWMDAEKTNPKVVISINGFNLQKWEDIPKLEARAYAGAEDFYDSKEKPFYTTITIDPKSFNDPEIVDSVIPVIIDAKGIGIMTTGSTMNEMNLENSLYTRDEAKKWFKNQKLNGNNIYTKQDLLDLGFEKL